MSRHDRLRHLGGLEGLALGYHDIWGGWHEPGEHTLATLLSALGLDVTDEEALERSIAQAEERDWRRPVGPARVVPGDAPLRVPVVVPAGGHDPVVAWTLRAESGACLGAGEQPASSCEHLDERWLDGAHLRRVMLAPDVVPGDGYHTLEVAIDGAVPVTQRLVGCPRRCHLPPGLAGGARVWGVTVQLYALRSAGDWGIGDLGALRLAIDALAGLGADLVGVNPLHAPFLAHPDRCSPYSPSSRRFLNPLYLDVAAVPDVDESAQARALLESEAFGARLAAVRAAPLVEYAEAAALKLEVLRLAHASFLREHVARDTARARDFAEFRARGGDALERHAAFEALDGGALADGAGPAEADPQAVAFHVYLQWLTAGQVAACAAHARAAGMRVGLYMDLAVGADAAGAEVWSSPGSFAAGVSIGAPPDDFSPTGQVWNLPPWRPRALAESGYEPFVETLRAAMRGAGALRIDHVVGLLRQFWVPAALGPADGAYVGFPVRDLLSILALESERHGCLVVGEDLGTVPDEMRAMLHEHGVLSYRVLYFERHWHGDRSFRRPHELPPDALVSVSTHDLPTLAGFWSGHDLEVRDALGRLPADRPLEVSLADRAGERAALLRVLDEQGLALAGPPDPASTEVPPDLALAVHRYVARAPSLVMSVQIEDVLGLVDQANLPGTTTEQPNWRRRIPLPVEDWADDPALAGLAAAIAAERGGA